MMTITYIVKNGIYVNMTNRCPCACVFCLRKNGAGVYGSDPLWLDREPSVEEVCRSIDAMNPKNYDEVVFCGYGEPTERLADLLQVAAHVKETCGVKIRINTNGLSDLINNCRTAPKLQGLIDTVSISLNAATREDYFKLVNPKFGMGSYDAMLSFTKDCVNYVPEVVMTIVDGSVSKEEEERCREICASVGAVLRIRPLEK